MNWNDPPVEVDKVGKVGSSFPWVFAERRNSLAFPVCPNQPWSATFKDNQA